MVKTKGYPEALEKKLHDQRYFREDSNPEFTTKVKSISRTIAHMCYQCGTCTGSCPSAPRSTYRIRKFMRRAVLGLENEALTRTSGFVRPVTAARTAARVTSCPLMLLWQ